MGKLKRGDIFYANVGTKCHPCIVVQNDKGNKYSSRVIVVPLTTSVTKMSKPLPTHCIICWGKIRPSVVECEEVTHINYQDNFKVVEHLPPWLMDKVDKCLKIAMDLR